MGVCVVDADVHPPKSSSAVTVGCVAFALDADEMGSPQPPAMSFGVIRAGGRPRSIVGLDTFAGAGSGAPQPALSFPVDPHGSNMAEF